MAVMFAQKTAGFLRRRWKWLAVIAAALLLLAFLLAPRASEASRRFDQLRAEGLPTTPAELDRWYALVPADQNIAGPLLDAATGLRGAAGTNLPFIGTGPLPKRGDPLPVPARAQMMEFVSGNQESFTELHAALQRPRARFPINLSGGGMNLVLPHLVVLKRTANAFALEAYLAADRREPDRAFHALNDGLRLGDIVKTEPTIISMLVGIACHAITIGAAEHVLSRDVLGDAELAKLQHAFRHSASNQTFATAMLGEICLAESIRHLSASNVVEMFGPSNPASLSEMAQIAGLWLYAASGMTRRDYAAVVEILDDQRRNALRPFPERWHNGRKIAEEANRKLSRQFLPLAGAFVFPNSSAKDGRIVATLEAASVACAVERYRRAHNQRLPESLNALVPDVLEAIPHDPIDGQPLRYRPFTNGYVVYSIGEDERDDGGVEYRNRPKKGPNQGWDYTFVVQRGAGKED
ncbi:MAG TPA: hypothetical protein DCE44_07010 [Verrucomicrobiales bacterium]|nr:hypothetical protein [Verrucomicrobiales bacterium]